MTCRCQQFKTDLPEAFELLQFGVSDLLQMDDNNLENIFL